MLRVMEGSMSLIIAMALASLSLTPVSAIGGPEKMHACAARWQGATPAQRGSMTTADFMAICARAEPLAPPGATARCRDGTYSTSTAALGRCAAHGGVARLL
jgi:hypothetical protein